MSNRYIGLIFLTVLSVSPIDAVQAGASQPTLTDYSVGEQWIWQFKGVTTEGVVRADGIDTKTIVSIDGVPYLSGESSKVPLAEVVKPEVSPTPRFSWPLEVGKEWTFEQTWTSQDGTTGKSTFDAHVVSFGEKHVEAGVFMAYTITYKGKITNSRGYSADTEEVFWYAPATKNFIKLTQTQQDYVYEEELIEYSKPE